MQTPSLGSPLVRYFILKLTNGATLRLPIVSSSPKPVVATQDIFNHSLWAHRIKTDASIAKEQDIQPDMTDFYAKFSAKEKSRGPRKGGKA
ncbi:hypothetical protein QJQ45_008148 [Haematococcus lacustris]|nr:hypothetical protein QJQ45_008148 [Haematococcus lacustris]